MVSSSTASKLSTFWYASCERTPAFRYSRLLTAASALKASPFENSVSVRRFIVMVVKSSDTSQSVARPGCGWPSPSMVSSGS